MGLLDQAQSPWAFPRHTGPASGNSREQTDWATQALGESSSHVLSLPGADGCARDSALPEQQYTVAGIWQGLHQVRLCQLVLSRMMPVEDREHVALLWNALEGTPLPKNVMDN